MQDDQDICGEIVFHKGQGSCTQEISVIQLPEQDLHEDNLSSHDSTGGGSHKVLSYVTTYGQLRG